MDNEFKGKIIFSENYQSTIESIKLINSTGNQKVSIKKQNTEFVDSSLKSDISIIKGYETITEITINTLSPPDLISAYDESIIELSSLGGKVRCIAHC